MTGTGRDGVEGCKAILAAEGFTLGQDEATSVVYGVNKAAFLEELSRFSSPLMSFQEFSRRSLCVLVNLNHPRPLTEINYPMLSHGQPNSVEAIHDLDWSALAIEEGSHDT